MDQNCGDTGGKGKPGKESPVKAEEVYARQNPHASRSGERSETKVAKFRSLPSRKAAIVSIVPVP